MYYTSEAIRRQLPVTHCKCWNTRIFNVVARANPITQLIFTRGVSVFVFFYYIFCKFAAAWAFGLSFVYIWKSWGMCLWINCVINLIELNKKIQEKKNSTSCRLKQKKQNKKKTIRSTVIKKKPKSKGWTSANVKTLSKWVNHRSFYKYYVEIWLVFFSSSRILMNTGECWRQARKRT